MEHVFSNIRELNLVNTRLNYRILLSACAIKRVLLYITEVNCYLAFRYFVWDEERKMDFMAFRSKLGWALINNEFKRNEESQETRSKKRKKVETHHLETAPKYARKWLGSRWDKSCKQEYQ